VHFLHFFGALFSFSLFGDSTQYIEDKHVVIPRLIPQDHEREDVLL
jgi:hypothetical protein